MLEIFQRLSFILNKVLSVDGIQDPHDLTPTYLHSFISQHSSSFILLQLLENFCLSNTPSSPCLLAFEHSVSSFLNVLYTIGSSRFLLKEMISDDPILSLPFPCVSFLYSFALLICCLFSVSCI